MDSVSLLIMAVSVLGLGAALQYLLIRLAAFAAWQKSVTDAMLKLAQDATELANKED